VSQHPIRPSAGQFRSPEENPSKMPGFARGRPQIRVPLTKFDRLCTHPADLVALHPRLDDSIDMKMDMLFEDMGRVEGRVEGQTG